MRPITFQDMIIITVGLGMFIVTYWFIKFIIWFIKIIRLVITKSNCRNRTDKKTETKLLASSKKSKIKLDPKAVKSIPKSRSKIDKERGYKLSYIINIKPIIERVLKIIWFILRVSVKIIVISIHLFFVLSLFYSIWRFLSFKPGVVKTSYLSDSELETFREPIEIIFDRPINYKDLQVSASPDYFKYKVEPIYLLEDLQESIERNFNLDLKHKLVGGIKVVPLSTVESGQPLVIYIANIRSIVGNFEPQEFALNLNVPPAISKLTPVNLKAEQKDVLTDAKILFKSDEPILDNVKLTASFDPFCDFVKVLQKSPYEIEVACGKPLEQGQKYHLEIEAVSVYAERESGDSMYVAKEFKAGEKTLASFDFYTVNPPGIKKFKPNGESVHSDSNIYIEFDEPMDTDSVLRHLQISPMIDYEIKWNESLTQLTINPEMDLKKDTKYTIILQKGVKTLKGGITHNDIKHDFKTIGRVKVSSISPRNGSTGLSTKPTIAVKFNQEVVHASAESHFKLTPSVKGKFWWKGNIMYFKPTSSLKYLTKYKITVSAGIKSKYGLDSTKTYTSYFTTKSETFILGVPLYHQQETFTCNIASTRMALAYKGIYLSESQIKSGIGIGQALSGSTGGDPNQDWINNYGVHWDPVASFIRRYRKASVKRNWNTVSLVKEVKAGHPVILWWHNRFSSFYWKSWTTPGGYKVTGLNGMHSEVVVGFKGSVDNPTVIIVNDPWRGRLYYSRSTFEWNWSRSFGRTAVVVY